MDQCSFCIFKISSLFGVNLHNVSSCRLQKIWDCIMWAGMWCIKITPALEMEMLQCLEVCITLFNVHYANIEVLRFGDLADLIGDSISTANHLIIPIRVFWEVFCNSSIIELFNKGNNPSYITLSHNFPEFCLGKLVLWCRNSDNKSFIFHERWCDIIGVTMFVYLFLFSLVIKLCNFNTWSMIFIIYIRFYQCIILFIYLLLIRLNKCF